MEIIKNIVRKLFPYVYTRLSLLREVRRSLRKNSYSQFGEDAILQKLIRRTSGFYVDIGAYHPIKFSNTYSLYRMGWRGINIDALPNSMSLFKRLRPRDINVEIGIGNSEKPAHFYIFKEPAFNTFSQDAYQQYVEKGIPFIKSVEVQTSTLASILDKYLPPQQHIDIMSIDVEGLDLQVLQSNNWDIYKPDYIAIEIHAHTIESIQNSEIYNYLVGLGYTLIAFTVITFIFKHENVT